MSPDILANLGAARTKHPHRHRWDWLNVEDGSRQMACPCGAIKDEAKSRRGKTARQRGNAYEREIAHKLGIRRTGQYGDKADVTGDWLVIQAKNGGAFPERIWRWLDELPHGTDRLRAVVIGDAPGPGTKRRNVICMDLDDFAAWFVTPKGDE
jgi:hypothetical protein